LRLFGFYRPESPLLSLILAVAFSGAFLYMAPKDWMRDNDMVPLTAKAVCNKRKARRGQIA
jgi:hypothetical protein